MKQNFLTHRAENLHPTGALQLSESNLLISGPLPSRRILLISQPISVCFNAKCPSGYACGTDYICCANATTICSPDVQAGSRKTFCAKWDRFQPVWAINALVITSATVRLVSAARRRLVRINRTSRSRVLSSKYFFSCHKWAETGFCSNPYLTHEDKLICIKTCGLC